MSNDATVRAVADLNHSPLEGRMTRIAQTVDEINRIGEQAALLFKRLDDERDALADEQSIRQDGGLSSHMTKAHEAWRATRASEQASMKRLHATR